jgi:hypothetical protein
MKKLICLVLISIVFFWSDCNTAFGQSEKGKHRVIVLTDIENEPDDAQSLVRFLLYSNQFDVEGLIATTSIHKKNSLATWRIKEIVEAYGKVRDNLLIHEQGYPEQSYLENVIKEGYPAFGMEAVGQGFDSEGSDWIIETVDKKDDRPLWVLVWGGPNCLSQALYKISMTRSPYELDEFVSKLRVYTISDQDDSAPWLRKNFLNLFYIASPGYHSKGAYHYATWTGISGDKFHGRFQGADFSLVDNPWLDENIRKDHGPLGAQYPWTDFLMEGDSPSFLYLINNGLGSSENPNYGSWGGRYERYIPNMQKRFYEPETRPFWACAVDEVMGIDGNYYTGNKETIWRWRMAYQHDFAARMDWTFMSYENANHPPVVVLDHPSVIKARPGETVVLNAAGSIDPDGHQLKFNWIYYREVGTYEARHPVVITDFDKAVASIVVPDVEKPETIHFIVEVTDNGTPSLTRYQRVIVVALPRQ